MSREDEGTHGRISLSERQQAPVRCRDQCVSIQHVRGSAFAESPLDRLKGTGKVLLIAVEIRHEATARDVEPLVDGIVHPAIRADNAYDLRVATEPLYRSVRRAPVCHNVLN